VKFNEVANKLNEGKPQSIIAQDYRILLKSFASISDAQPEPDRAALRASVH